MYLLIHCCLILLLSFVPGIFAQSVTVDPATAKLDDDVLITFIFTPEAGDDLVFLSWFKSDADGVTQGNNIISNISGNTVSGRYSLNNEGGLIISNVEVEDAGYYLCIVTTVGANNADGFSTLTVYYLYKPVLSSFATPVNEGDMVVISCSADANPTPTYTFKKDGELQQQGGSSTLTFNAVSRNDDGSYECEASNSAGTETSDSRILDVYYAPEITPLSNMQVSPGDEVVIRFDVVAKPAATYVWTTTPDTTDTDSNPETYTFTVSNNINETYSVTLEASNVVGATQASVEVTVVADGGDSGGVDGGSSTGVIVGIVLGCLVVMVILGGIFYSYRAEKYCFSENGNKTSEGTSERVVLNETLSDNEANNTYAEVQKPKQAGNSDKAVAQPGPPKPKRAGSRENKSDQPKANVEQLTYAELDLTKDVNDGNKGRIIRTEPETEYSSVMVNIK